MLRNPVTRRRPEKQPASAVKTQHGMALLEALIAILVLSFGILGLVGLQATAVSASADARYRSEASYFIDQLIGAMQVDVNRSSASALQASLNSYSHRPTTTGTCDFDGGTSGAAVVTNWISAVTNAATGLPGAGTDSVQIAVSTADSNRVTVTVCWQTPQDKSAGTWRQHTTVAYIN